MLFAFLIAIPVVLLLATIWNACRLAKRHDEETERFKRQTECENFWRDHRIDDDRA